MPSRRMFLRGSAALVAAMSPGGFARADRGFYMPDEAAPHARTWMAFGASAEIWGDALLPRVQGDLARIANAISRFEAVTMLVRPEEIGRARGLLSDDVRILPCELDDLWIRDTGPLFVFDEDDGLVGLDFNFNGWGEKQAYDLDAEVAYLVSRRAGTRYRRTDLVLEGGSVEVDGEGTAIISESCVLNDNRNPGISRAEFEDLLCPLLGLDRIIWLPGIRGRDITDGHTDFYARFTRPGHVVVGYDPNPDSFDHEVTLRHREILAGARDARGRSLAVTVLEAPHVVDAPDLAEDFAAGYLGYYLCNGAVIMQRFGDPPRDSAAQAALARAFPDRVIEALSVDGIAAGGGSIHCATQQEPKW